MKIHSYKEATDFIKAAACGKLNLLVVVSRGGLAKTTMVKNALQKSNENHVVLSCHVTGLELYKQLYEHKDKLIVINDVDTLLTDKVKVSLLKSLCETTKEKTVEYHSSSPLAGDVPSSFITHSRVIILLNDLKRLSSDNLALLTRGIILEFVPSATEVLKYLQEYARNLKVFDWLRGNAQHSTKLNLRHYELAVEMEAAGLDWVNWLTQELQINPRTNLAQKIILSGKPYKEQITTWKEQTGLSGRQLDHYRKSLKLTKSKA